MALATLDVFEAEATLEKLPAKIDRLAEHLVRIARHPHVGDTRQQGMIAGIELVSDKSQQTPFAWQEQRGLRACKHALRQGVWLRPLGSVIVILPPLAISLDELDRICLAAEQGIDVATE